jgi:phosphate transport system permease protein
MSNIKVVKFIDKIASLFIKSGGVLVISCVALIIFMIFKVAFPLFLSPSITLNKEIELEAKNSIIEVGFSEYQDSYFTISKNGLLNIYSVDNKNKEIASTHLRSDDSPIFQINHILKDVYGIHWADGKSTFIKIASHSVVVEGVRANVLSCELIASMKVPYIAPPECVVSSMDFEKGEIVRVYTDNKKVYANVLKFETDEKGSELSGEGESFAFEAQKADKLFLTINALGDKVWIASNSGQISLNNLDHEKGFSLSQETNTDKEISAICNAFGDSSLLVAQSDGEVNSWISVRLDNKLEKKTIVRTHSLLKAGHPITKIQASFHDKSFLAFSEKGELYQVHLTTEKTVFSLKNLGIGCFALSPKGKGVLAIAKDKLYVYDINNPYGEVSMSILFDKVWYEGYSKPEYVWQSGSGGDDGESKLSLIPLIFGTLKGTFYAMLLSVPLALGSAIYISQFASATLRSYVKPAVEMMSAIPSVVVGFIAALWLAPQIDGNFFMVFMAIPVFIVMFFLNLIIWNAYVPIGVKKKAERGFHLIYLLPTFLMTILVLYFMCPMIEESVFQGEFKNKMIEFFSIKGYEQRNCIIIGFALGFTVIPIIFTISEDVLSAVPRTLMANSLALGANRWQSVWRVILPSASPGIIAGVIIGFGRAIGETMIVMMATGNTPITSYSIFNGMRTLSANIAVEIGEASFEGTLYRVLFLSAVILFIMTFILNTGAELVRQALRKKFSQF